MSLSSISSSNLTIGAQMAGASGTANGTAGIVPTPVAGDQVRFLRGDGTYATPSFTGIISPEGVQVGSVGNTYFDTVAQLPYTKATGTNTNTGWVLSGGSGAATKSSVTQAAHGFVVGDVIRLSGAATYTKAQANSAANGEVVGIVTTVTSASVFTVTTGGYVSGLTGLTANSVYFLSDATAGLLTLTEPTAVSSISKPILYTDATTGGYILPYRASPAQGQTAVIQYGEQAMTQGSTFSTALADVAGATVTIPSAGTWEINYFAYYLHNTGGTRVGFGLYTTADVLVPNSQAFSASVSGSTSSPLITQKITVITTGATTYKLKAVTAVGQGTITNSGTGTDTSANSKITYVQIGAAPVPMDLAGEYGEQVIANGTAIGTAIGDIQSFTIPTAGTWDVSYNIFASNASTLNSYAYSITDSANTFLANSTSRAYAGNNVNGRAIVVASQTVRITTTGSTIYKIRGISNAASTVLTDNTIDGSLGSATGATSRVYWRKISGFTPSSGQTVDFIAVNRTAGYTTTLNQAVVFDVTIAGNIPYSAGQFTLFAGKTYELSASLRPNTTATTLQYQWFNVTTASSVGVVGTAFSNNAGGTSGDQLNAYYVFTPSTNTIVELRPTSSTALAVGVVSSFASIKQLGSSAVLVSPNPNPVVQVFTASGTYTPTAGMKYCIVEMVGGGGGGSGTTAPGANTVVGSGGGSSGGYIKALLTAAQIGASQAVTIGTGGAGGVATAGSSGTSTTLGTLLSANAGVNGTLNYGTLSTANAGLLFPSGAVGGGSFSVTTGTDLGSRTGYANVAGSGFVNPTASSLGFKPCDGSPTFFGQQSFGTYSSVSPGTNSSTTGINAAANSGGGGGGGTSTGTSTSTGGNGAAGKMVITEYFYTFIA